MVFKLFGRTGFTPDARAFVSNKCQFSRNVVSIMRLLKSTVRSVFSSFFLIHYYCRCYYYYYTRSFNNNDDLIFLHLTLPTPLTDFVTVIVAVMIAPHRTLCIHKYEGMAMNDDSIHYEY